MPCWKLVRDKIGEKYLSERTPTVVVEKAEGERLVALLKAKIVEEALELASSQTRSSVVEEAADLVEVLQCLLDLLGVPLREVEEKAQEKREKLGSFKEGYVVYWLDRDTC